LSGEPWIDASWLTGRYPPDFFPASSRQQKKSAFLAGFVSGIFYYKYWKMFDPIQNNPLTHQYIFIHIAWPILFGYPHNLSYHHSHPLQGSPPPCWMWPEVATISSKCTITIARHSSLRLFPPLSEYLLSTR
jgi:hypothetical protein